MGSYGDSSFYGRLGVDRRASRGEIVHAYRRLARGVHPDTHPEDLEAAGRFREITEAYEVLGDPRRRADYDRRLRGSRIEVRVYPASRERSTRPREATGHRYEGEPVVLDAARPGRSGVPLRVGPVSYGCVGKPGDRAGSADRSLSDLSGVLRELVEWWWDR